VGFVLATSAERYLWISAGRYEWAWITRPGVIVIALITIALTVAGARLRKTVREEQPHEG
jgi:hypothetical protein